MLHPEQKPKLDEDYKYETEIFNQELEDPSGDLETDGTENVKVIEKYEKPVEETTVTSNTKNNFEVPYPGAVAEEVEGINTESESDVKGENEFGVEDERVLESVGEDEEQGNVEKEIQTDLKEDVAEQIDNDGTDGEGGERATTDKNEPLEIETESLGIENDDTSLTSEYELDLSASENDVTYQVPETLNLFHSFLKMKMR
ncbi:hypothetical protein Avbf_18308 [Armadillidium vulgare]|nr:hypothetical protein Avbf_18308 [Armadillidium vulgare]